MNGEWFRFYAEFIHDPKMKRFSIEEWGIWNGLLCLACESPKFGSLYIGKDIKYELDDIIIAFNGKLEKSVLKGALDKMEELGMIEYDDNKAIMIKNFKERQSSVHPRMVSERVERYRKRDCNEIVTAVSRDVTGIDKIREDKIREDKIKRGHNFRPPLLKEVEDYCKERNNGIIAQNFIDFYSSKGWLIGKNKMRDWRAAIRTWENRNKPVKTELTSKYQKYGSSK